MGLLWELAKMIQRKGLLRLAYSGFPGGANFFFLGVIAGRTCWNPNPGSLGKVKFDGSCSPWCLLRARVVRAWNEKEAPPSPSRGSAWILGGSCEELGRGRPALAPREWGGPARALPELQNILSVTRKWSWTSSHPHSSFVVIP